MRSVLAALDAGAAARPVVETALGLGRLMDAGVRALHVGDRAAGALEALTRQSCIPLRTVPGQVETAILRAAADPETLAAVLGARATPGGRRPAGATALQIMQRSDKPVVVVPPEAVGISPRPFRRLLVPLDGTEAAARPVVERLCPLVAEQVEYLVLHVFTSTTVPRFLDRPGDLELLGHEFLARNCPQASRILWRTGPVSARVIEVCGELAADMVVLSWSGDRSADHAPVVHEVLGCSSVPVLVLPLT
jgi:nucleotide-binding universal stress UspA family protein